MKQLCKVHVNTIFIKGQRSITFWDYHCLIKSSTPAFDAGACEANRLAIKVLREQLSFKKTGKKLAEVWEAHCVDAWILTYSSISGKTTPDNQRLVCMIPLNWHHRQLHRFKPEKGGKRKPCGGTLSQGIKRGTLVSHPRWGKATVGGTMDGKLSLHDPYTNKRLTQTAKVTDCLPIKLLRWRTRLVPPATISTSPAPKKEDLLPPWLEKRGVSANRIR